MIQMKENVDMICWFENHSNEVQRNPLDVFLISSRYTSGFQIDGRSFRLSIALFIARTVVHPKWCNSSNVYFEPNCLDASKILDQADPIV